MPDTPNDDFENQLTEPRLPLQGDDEPTVLAGETADLDPRLLQDQPEADEHDVPFHLPKSSPEASPQETVPRPATPNSAPTMPHFREPGVADPRITLVGTGGLDPNPDMYGQSEKTVQHIPKVQAQYAPIEPIQAPQVHLTPPQVQDVRFQRPQQAAKRQTAQGHYVPAPQVSANKTKLPQRRGARRILGIRPGCFYMVLGLMLTFCGGLFFIIVGAAAFFIPQLDEQWSGEIARVDDYRAFESTFYYDRYGNQLYEAFNEGRRDTVPYEQFPQHLIHATISIEDDSFFQNIGIDIGATVVATLGYLSDDSGQTPGGSTITQQLVRNVLFDFERRSERSVSRKLEEILLAILLTTRRSKQDILALYLNEIYYGNLSYGAQAASQTFFGKDVQDLTLGEAALLAGLPQAPSSLDPLNPDPTVQERVYGRWRLVLEEMQQEGYITQEQMNEAFRAGLNYAAPDENNLLAPHFTVYAQGELRRLMVDLGYSEEDVAKGGYRVYTTLDQDINNLALETARNQVLSLQRSNVTNASVVVLEPITGEIIAMVGSIDYYSDVIDGRVNVAIALRQPGSTMKAFTYAAALERGMTAGDVIWDTRTEIGIPGQAAYIPRNYDGRFHGPMAMREALANSYNIPAVQTLRIVGVDYLLDFLHRLGISTLTDPSQYGISLTLGGGEVSLLEFANAYGVFANQGAYVQTTSIRCILDSNNQIVYQYENGCPNNANFTPNTVDRRGFGIQALDPRIAYIITDILSDNAARSTVMGSNSPLRTDGIATSVKTGTTNDIKDNWTMGYTRNVVVGVWVGNNDGQPMVNSSGLTGAAPIWNAVMRGIYSNASMLDVFRVDGQLLPDKPNNPAGMSLRQICFVDSITDPSTGCPRQINEWFLDGPAGIPDGSGNLSFPNNPPLQGQAVNQSATLQEVSPDVYRAVVFPLAPQIAASLQFNLQPGDLPPPPPKYCRVRPEQVNQATGAQQLIFIAGPATSQSDAVRAEEYAREQNLAFLPTIECWAEAFSGGASWGGGGAVTTALITSPANGQTFRLTDAIVVNGTVQFDPSIADFYHLDIIGGQFGDWTPLGEEVYGSIVNGSLGVLNPYALPVGTYRLRVRLMKNGSFVQQPYEVSFNVVE